MLSEDEIVTNCISLRDKHIQNQADSRGHVSVSALQNVTLN